MVKFILIKSPDEWATTKQACRDELVVYLFFSPIYIYIYIYIFFFLYIYIYIFIWQAPRAGSMRRILSSDWLPERARWNDTARPGLPVSFPQIKFRQSSSECTKVFSRSLFTFLWTSTSSRSIKTQKENSANIQPS